MVLPWAGQPEKKQSCIRLDFRDDNPRWKIVHPYYDIGRSFRNLVHVFELFCRQKHECIDFFKISFEHSV